MESSKEKYDITRLTLLPFVLEDKRAPSKTLFPLSLFLSLLKTLFHPMDFSKMRVKYKALFMRHTGAYFCT